MWLAIIVLLGTGPVAAITWNFDEDNNRQGWQVRENITANFYMPLLSSSVENGSWWIPIPPASTGIAGIELSSPLINHPSGLFDRAVIRFRIMHTRPVRGSWLFTWTNALNLLRPGSEIDHTYCDIPPCFPRFWIDTAEAVYTTDWQEVIIEDLRSRPAIRARDGAAYEIRWEEELFDIRFRLTFPADEVPQAIEIDRIVLTGVEEHLTGERPPPPVQPLGERGSWFSLPQFIPLGQQGLFGILGSPFADLDGDGKLDLVLSFWHRPTFTTGLLRVNNLGQGRFLSESIPLSARSSEWLALPVVAGAQDLNGDGRADLVFKMGDEIEVLLSDPHLEGAYRPITIASSGTPLQLADFDGDGTIDVLVSTGFQARILYNDGLGNFSAGDPFGLRDFHVHSVGDINGDGQWEVIWGPTASSRQRVIQITPAVIEPGERGSDHAWGLELAGLEENGAFSSSWVRYVGDLNSDGYPDAILLKEYENDPNRPGYGLQLAFNDGSQRLHLTDWYDERIESTNSSPVVSTAGHSIQAWDLTNDGQLNVVVVNHNPRFPGVMVHFQQDNRLLLEGYYPLEGGDGGAVWAGDLDGDGYLDLVVIDSQGGGLHVLYNQLGKSTAVTAEPVVAFRPGSFVLGANYPNPFNPRTTLPFTLEREGWVRLRVYDLRGRPVRTLWDGLLPAGAQRLEWDGRNDAGQTVASGVYFYRLEAGGQVHSRKLLKLD